MMDIQSVSCNTYAGLMPARLGFTTFGESQLKNLDRERNK